MQNKEEGVKLQIAIRCARAANLLSSLRNSGHFGATINNEDLDVEKEIMRREIGDLKVELVRERMKRKKLQLSILMEVVLHVAMLLLVSGLLLIIAFKFIQN
ncbi:Mediator of RNA polymerase II transcription subunit like [Melia azedarach]|uniref:Mediator of RNA polymerase II transcription subunit like n=1 Tax=Melia azedarach TaxID=155640 RepID=A0ACC1WQ68_MELAZ|nr:Mediator of RNA polymerase II transcription subunit like [Melia azedarach]